MEDREEKEERGKLDRGRPSHTSARSNARPLQRVRDTEETVPTRRSSTSTCLPQTELGTFPEDVAVEERQDDLSQVVVRTRVGMDVAVVPHRLVGQQARGGRRVWRRELGKYPDDPVDVEGAGPGAT